MTQALDAAIRAACNTDPMYSKPCESYPKCDCGVWPRGARAALRAAVLAAMPAVLPLEFLHDPGKAYLALRARLLGEAAD